MKQISCIFLALMCICLLTGTTFDAAPVLPTKDFYVNDYADVLFREHLSQISEVARQTFDDTGVQFVLLTVYDLNNTTPEDYANAILTKWDVTAPNGYGMILLVDRSERECYLFYGEQLSGVVTDREFEQIKQELVQPFFEEGNFSTGIQAAYNEVSRRLYRKTGTNMNPMLEQMPKSSSGIPTSALIVILVALLALGRSLYVTHKYRRKYLYRHEYKRRSFSSKQFKDDDINPQHLRTNPHQGINSDPTIRKSGFIIYRDKEEDTDSTSK